MLIHAKRRVTLIIVVALLTSCSSSKSSGPGGSEPCSTGPAHASASEFRVEPTSSSESLPACVPRCEAQKAGVPASDIASVPSGTCVADGDRCGMGLQLYCDCPDGRHFPGARHGLACSCLGGHWDCVIVAQGGGVCPPCPTTGSTPDASADAAADGGEGI